MSREWIITVLSVGGAFVLAYFVLLNGTYALLTVAAFRAMRRYARRLQSVDVEDLSRPGIAPPVTLIAPAFNEEATCVEAVRSLLTLRYADYEILVVNDGSRDATLERLREAFELEPAPRAPTAEIRHQTVRGVWHSRRHPNLWVADKENGGGKADALNAGLAYCRTPLFCALDADTLLERDALSRIVRVFLENASTIAAGGSIRIVNDSVVERGSLVRIRLPRKILPRLQVLEYLRSFLAGRMGWNTIGGTLIISGAFGLFRRTAVVEAGGFATDTVGEDMELTVRLHRLFRERGIPYAITFLPDPVAWTECPESLRDLGRQRDRWHRGLTEVMLRHRRMLLRPRYGVIGLLAYPYFFFLETFGPVLEAAGYFGFVVALALGLVSPLYAAAFFLTALLLGSALSVAAVCLEELTFRRYPRVRDLVALMVLAAVEPFGYRQLNSVWRVRGLVRAWRGVEGWGEMTRRGFAQEKA
jgi:cellulose synthase/poly-beta-1,6-N-acetylglucosamine synthase-like glycosyltransferase